MSAPTQTRVPAGVAAGGQFSTTARGEAPLGLRVPALVHDPHGVLDAAKVSAVLALRESIVADGECNSTGGPSCGVTSEELAPILGGSETYGAYDLGGRFPEHAWVRLPDGTIVDATADQFGLSAVVVARPGDAQHARYLDRAGDDDF